MTSLLANQNAASEPAVGLQPDDPRQSSWLSRWAFRGCAADDSEEERRKKAVLTVTSVAKASMCLAWYSMYWLVGAPLAAAAPFVYQMLTIVNLLLFFRSKNFARFRNVQSAAILFAPWWMHLVLGGYTKSSALLLWPLLAPLTALLFHGKRQSLYWLAAYFGIVISSGLIDGLLPTNTPEIGPKMNLVFFCMNLACPSLIAYLAVRYFADLIDKEKNIQVRLNAEIGALNKRLAAENVRLGSELDVVRRLQMMVLPKQAELSRVPRLDISGYMRPADQVGGDYYDVLHLGSHTKIGIGDVTGHGLEAGLVMLMVQSVARALHEAGEHDPIRFLQVLNQAICKNVQRIDTDKNLSLAFLDFKEDRVVLSGQHEEVLVVHANNTLERIDTSDLGFPIGMELDIAKFVATREIRFVPGDVIVLYSDGVTEAADSAGALYGIDRLCQSVMASRQRTAVDIGDAAINDLQRFIGQSQIHDDISLVVIKIP